MPRATATTTLRLRIRTPSQTIVDEDVRAITAEDVTGRFGIRPRSESLLAALTPGLLSYQSVDEREVFVAVGKGVLDCQESCVEVAVREALVCGSWDEIESAIRVAADVHYEAETSLRGIFEKVHEHLLQALIDEERQQ